MYPTSQRYKDQIKQLTRDFTISILVTPKSGSAFTLTDADVTNGSVVFEDSVMSGDVLELGNTIAGSFEFEMILNPTNKLVDFAEASIQPTVTLILPATETYPTPSSESIPMGVFHIDSIDKGRKTTKFKALDNMSKLDVDYSKSTLVYPATLTQIYEDICSYCQVPVNPTQTLYEYTVPRKPKAGVTFRNVLGSIAEINASYAKCNRLGQIVIEWLKTNNSIATLIDPNVRSKLISDDFVQPITGVTMETMSNIYTGIGSQPGNVVSLSENLLIQNNQQAILNHFDNTGVYETFVVPHKTTWSGDPSIEAGDRVAVTTIDNESFNTNITHNKYKYRGSCEANCGAQVNGETNVIRSGSKNQSDTGDAVKSLAAAMGVYTTADGSGYYVHDQPNLEDSSQVWNSNTTVTPPPTYEYPWVIASDADFTPAGQNKFTCNLGGSVVVPTTIQQIIPNSYDSMFYGNAVLGVVSDNKFITSMQGMFQLCQAAGYDLDITKLYASSVLDVSGMFNNALYNSILFTGFDTSNVVDMGSMFAFASISSLDLRPLNTSKVERMDSMFSSSNISLLDISSLDTSSVKTMASMFYIFDTSQIDVSGFNTASVTDMSSMFRSCSAQITGLSSFNTGEVITMANMFRASSASELDLSSFTTTKVTNMSGMFYGSNATTIDVASFDTTNVTTMADMFRSSITNVLDLRSFDMSGVTTTNMLTGCSATTGIARTQADADILNAIVGKPTTLTFYPI